jgi:hypothetical protein
VFNRIKRLLKYKLLLSTFALVFGSMHLVSSCGMIARHVEDPTVEVPSNPLFGLQIILGTLAYRSLKRTRLGIRKKSILRTFGELCTLIAAATPTVLMLIYNPAAKFLIATAPIAWIIAPMWSYAAYLIMWTRPTITPESTHDSQ